MPLLKSLLLIGLIGLPSARAICLRDVNLTTVRYVIDEWMETGVETETFKGVMRALSLPSDFARHGSVTRLSEEKGSAICTVCRSVMKIAISSRRAGVPGEVIEKKIIRLCVLLGLQTAEVCRGVVELNAPILTYIIDGKPSLTSATVCGLIFQKDSCVITDEEYDWTIDVHEPREPSELLQVTRNSGDTMKILQITDIHYDPNYEPYGNADCKEPTCCRKGQRRRRRVASPGELAGYWGDYNNCDTPWHSVVNALDHMKETHRDLTFVYFTGDIIDHGVWETTRSGNIESLCKSYARIRETFPDIAVYPVVGNHEPHPLNLFAPTNVTDERFGTQWLYDVLADMWIQFGWLPESARATVRRGGYYTVSPREGFRIVAVNNNVCYTYNWWLLHQPRDPYGQLRWLVDELTEAEENGEFVHILLHLPAGDSQCYATWKREYLKIVQRFAHVITAQFNGHTHNDEVQMIYHRNDLSSAVNVAWNGGSVTTYSNLNPNYKVYTVSADNYVVMDFDSWMYNLTLANQRPTAAPRWYRAYSFKDEYSIPDLSLKSLSEWAIGMSKNKTMLKRYHRNFFKHAEPSLMEPCDTACLEAYVRRMTVIV